ncbi:MAG: TetR/AcrR family transcriptional regulator [Myxococcota bacterium]|nr:TetR/AcrR family transcriptional regulator [Myxococcota bacterium]
MSKREKRRNERQAAVLNAAAQLINTSGFDAVTMQSIAAAIGSSVGGLYRYFPNKESIFSALQTDAISIFDGTIAERHKAYSEPASRFSTLNRLVDDFGSWSRFRQTHPVQFTLLESFLSTPQQTLDKAGRDAVNPSISIVLARITESLENCVRSGALKPGPSGTRTYMLWASMHGVEQLSKRDQDTSTHGQSTLVRKMLIRDLLISWGAMKGLVDHVMHTGVHSG